MARPVTPKVAALIERGRQHAGAGEFSEAARSFERALQQMPELTDVHALRAESLQMLGRVEEAERAWRQVLRRDERNLAALEGMAYLCMAGRRLAELEDFAIRGHVAAPLAPGFCLTLGFTLWWQGRHDEALAAYRRGAELASGKDAAFFHEANLAEAMALFRLGRFDEGWQRYLWRQDRNALRERYPRLAIDPAALRAAAPQRIAVHSEQGIGDELFFLRFAPALRAKGHKLMLRTNPKLMPLLRTRADLFAEIADVGEPLNDCDVELQASDLALASGESFAPSLRFSPDEARRAALATRLAEFGPAPYIGVTWQAGLSGDEAKKWGGAYWSKRVAPASLGEMLRRIRGTPVVLQRNPDDVDIAALSASAGRRVIDMSEVNDDLLDAVALLALLDDYVGVSNTNMHLLAAIEGSTARVVLPLPAEWRWGMQGQSPWFPRFRLYRAALHDNVDDALAELQRDFLVR
jgi:tetratricopeptide (TPR) repeat protein